MAGEPMSAAPGRPQASSHRSPQGGGIPVSPRPLITRLRFAARRLGWPGLLGLALIGLAAPLLHWAADAQRQETQQLRSRLAAQRAAPAPKDPQLDAAERLARLQQHLSATPAALSTVEHMHRAAALHGLTLASGEYRLSGSSPALAQRYQITLPVLGPYPQLRDWLADVMNAQPALALEELSLSRQNAADAKVQARVRWTLYLKAD
ncbi:MAG: pilus assembly protein PilO [Comamonadaceae bacterium]|nr:pilus assembly protein PilO [Comamonadaceae bacterium]